MTDGCKYCGEPIGTGKGFICRTCKDLKTRYGMLRTHRDKLLEEQDWSCALCTKFIQTEERRKADTAVVDHCHVREEKTRRLFVRGMLCLNCNKDIDVVERFFKKYKIEDLYKYINGGKEIGIYTAHREKLIKEMEAA